jgi:hypothetical protein
MLSVNCQTITDWLRMIWINLNDTPSFRFYKEFPFNFRWWKDVKDIANVNGMYFSGHNIITKKSGKTRNKDY